MLLIEIIDVLTNIEVNIPSITKFPKLNSVDFMKLLKHAAVKIEYANKLGATAKQFVVEYNNCWVLILYNNQNKKITAVRVLMRGSTPPCQLIKLVESEVSEFIRKSLI